MQGVGKTGSRATSSKGHFLFSMYYGYRAARPLKHREGSSACPESAYVVVLCGSGGERWELSITYICLRACLDCEKFVVDESKFVYDESFHLLRRMKDALDYRGFGHTHRSHVHSLRKTYQKERHSAENHGKSLPSRHSIAIISRRFGFNSSRNWPSCYRGSPTRLSFVLGRIRPFRQKQTTPKTKKGEAYS